LNPCFEGELPPKWDGHSSQGEGSSVLGSAKATCRCECAKKCARKADADDTIDASNQGCGLIPRKLLQRRSGLENPAYRPARHFSLLAGPIAAHKPRAAMRVGATDSAGAPHCFPGFSPCPCREFEAPGWCRASTADSRSDAGSRCRPGRGRLRRSPPPVPQVQILDRRGGTWRRAFMATARVFVWVR